ncbi:MAG: methionine--tRNA ligase, partial [Pseudomonadota bacterium]
TIEGQKMSKSLGNVIAPAELVETYGLDQTRYFLLREVPFGNDGDFSRRAMFARANGELANDIGNLAQRVLSMIHKNCDAQIPAPGPLQDADNTLLAAADGMLATVRDHLDAQAFHKALETIWQVVGDANRYVDDQAPWTLKKTDPERMKTVLYTLAETIRSLFILCQPFMPDSSAKLLVQLGYGEGDVSFDQLGNDNRLAPATPIEKPQPIFPRLEEPEAVEA